MEPRQQRHLYGKGGDIASNRRDEQELSVLCLRVLQAAMVFVNTLMVQDVLADEEWATALTDADRRGLTPLSPTPVSCPRITSATQVERQDRFQGGGGAPRRGESQVQSMNRIVIAVLCAILLSAGSLATTSASAGETARAEKRNMAGIVDITTTEQGRMAVARLSGVALGLEQGTRRAPTFRALTGVPGDAKDAIWVIPSDGPIPTVTRNEQGLLVTTTAEPVQSESAALKMATAVQPLAAKGIAWQAPYCYARYSTSVGWLDHCRQFASVTYDGDSSRDHWVLKQYGTCKSNPGFRLSSCSLSSIRQSNTATQYWEDWAPRADTSGGCRDVSISVTAYGVGVSGGYTACETNDITKYSEASRFTAAYVGGAANSERAVQSQIAVGVPQGSLPKFTLSWAVKGVVLL